MSEIPVILRAVINGSNIVYFTESGTWVGEGSGQEIINALYDAELS